MSDCTCGCCKTAGSITPISTINRPGLPALNYRVGRYADFLESIRMRLASFSMDVQDGERQVTLNPLADLTTRNPADPSIALLDVWAIVGDVLTFYSERIANEGYLATASDRQSLVLLSALTGYAPRPGVASGTLLAYTLQKDAGCTIPAGSAAQNVPPQNKPPQTYETSSDLDARAEWNNLQPRQTRPQTIDPVKTQQIYLDGISTQLQSNDMLLIVKGDLPGVPRWVQSVEIDQLNLKTIVTLRVQANLMDISDSAFDRLINFYLSQIAQWRFKNQDIVKAVPDAVKRAIKDAKNAFPISSVEDFIPALIAILHQKIQDVRNQFGGPELRDNQAREPALAIWHSDLVGALMEYGRCFSKALTVPPEIKNEPDQPTDLDQLLTGMSKPPSAPKGSAASLSQNFATAFSKTSDVVPRALLKIRPELDRQLYKAYAAATVSPAQDVRVYAMRTKAPLYGHNAPKEPVSFTKRRGEEIKTVILPRKFWREPQPSNAEGPEWVYLDNVYDKITRGSPFVLVSAADLPRVLLVNDVTTISRSDYGLSAKVTQLFFETDNPPWFPWRAGLRRSNFSFLRQTVVYAQPEELKLAQKPITDPFPEDPNSSTVELAQLYDGLIPGKLIVVSGERSDLPGAIGTEIAMIQHVDQRTAAGVPGDQTHTFLTFANKLNYRYVRGKVALYGNVVAATQGQSQNEVLGSGDGQQEFQSFRLKQSPLTFVSAETASGAESTLSVTVNSVRWKQVSSLSQAGATAHQYVSSADTQGRISVTFGDGLHGSRLPSGTNNISATYRVGIGQSGNVDAQTITTLLSRPLGVSGVTNPIAATGGADADPLETIRRNAPVGLSALDRLVSLDDYEDYARQFAGFAKASAARLAMDGRQIIHVTVAAQNDAPLTAATDSIIKLRDALLKYGDPHLAVVVAPRRLKAMLLQATVYLQADYSWDAAKLAVVDALTATFSFDNQEFGEPVFLSQVVSTIQSVPGVDWVFMETLEGITESTLSTASEISTIPAKLQDGQPANRVTAHLARRRGDAIEPAEIVHVLPAVPELILLKQGKS